MSKLASNTGGFYFEFEEVVVTKYTSTDVFINGNWFKRETHLRVIHPDEKTSKKLLIKAIGVHEGNLLKERQKLSQSLLDLSNRRDQLEKLIEKD